MLSQIQYTNESLTMWIVRGLSLVIVITLCTGVNCEIQESLGAQVVPWEPLLSEPSIIKGVNMHKCSRPIEDPDAHFKNCRPSDPEEHFPATKATCECTLCNLHLSLVCSQDGRWFSSSTNNCDPNTPGVQCGSCPPENTPAHVRCKQRPLPGYLGESRECSCKNNCLASQLLCGPGGEWRLEDRFRCDLTSFHYVDRRAVVTFSDGHFSLSCSSEAKPTKEGVVTCIEGVFHKINPKCAKDDRDNTSIHGAIFINSDIISSKTTSLFTSQRPEELKQSDPKITIIIITLSTLLAITSLICIVFITLRCRGLSDSSYMEASDLQSKPKTPFPSAGVPPAYLEPMQHHHYDEIRPTALTEEVHKASHSESGIYDDVFNNLPALPYQGISCSSSVIKKL